MSRVIVQLLRRVIWGSIFGLVTLIFGRSRVGNKVRRSLNMLRRIVRF